MLAPGQSFNRPWVWHSEPVTEADQFGHIAKMLVGCVTYQTTFDDVKHQTAFVYVVELDPEDDSEVIFKPWAGSFAN